MNSLSKKYPEMDHLKMVPNYTYGLCHFHGKAEVRDNVDLSPEEVKYIEEKMKRVMEIRRELSEGLGKGYGFIEKIEFLNTKNQVSLILKPKNPRLYKIAKRGENASTYTPHSDIVYGNHTHGDYIIMKGFKYKQLTPENFKGLLIAGAVDENMHFNYRIAFSKGNFIDFLMYRLFLDRKPREKKKDK